MDRNVWRAQSSAVNHEQKMYKKREKRNELERYGAIAATEEPLLDVCFYGYPC